MKRLLLASSGLAYVKEFVHSNPTHLKMLFIPTAGNLYKDVWWIDKDRVVLGKMGFNITELDIESASLSNLENTLNETDVVYVAGGNTFYLLNQVRKSGFDTLITNYVNSGGMYIGASAGALIAGPDIGPIASIDDPEKVPDLESTAGLNFTNIISIPHYNVRSSVKAIDKIKDEFSSTYEISLMTDDEAIEVEDDKWRIVESRRSETELDWFKRFAKE